MTRTECLDEAKRIISGQREDTYGGPEDSFKRIALLWTAYLKGKYGIDFDLAPVDVALLMAQLKTARLMADPGHTDSAVDGAGYFACAVECSHKETAARPATFVRLDEFIADEGHRAYIRGKLDQALTKKPVGPDNIRFGDIT